MDSTWVRGLILGLTVFLYAIISEKFWPDLNKVINGLIAAILGVIVFLLLNQF